MAERATENPEYLTKAWLDDHLRAERKEADLLSEVREAIFGAQDGVTSILAVVITVATATSNQYAVLVAGIAAAIAEVISMGAGEYMSSKSQREIFLAQIEKERLEVVERPHEATEVRTLPADHHRHVPPRDPVLDVDPTQFPGDGGVLLGRVRRGPCLDRRPLRAPVPGPELDVARIGQVLDERPQRLVGGALERVDVGTEVAGDHQRLPH
jgi:hypothetical protein